MRSIAACLLVLLVAPFALADGPSLQSARQRWLHGNCAEAREQYETLARDAKLKSAAAIGVSRCWQSEGEYDKALAAIDAALANAPKDADLHAGRAELLHLRGRWKDADAACGRALAVNKDHLLARWVRAQVLRDRGEQKEADGEMRWFVRYYNDAEVKSPEGLVLIGLAGAENARWHNLKGQFADILNGVYADALEADKEYWPAEYQAGVLLLEKYNRPQALEAFDKALKINPNAAEALVGKGQLALQSYQVREAVQFAERALKINLHLPEALRLRADLHLLEGDVGAALKELDEARIVNPRDEATLGRVAACLLLQRKKEDFDTLVKEVIEHDPKPGVFYHELAERLDERRRYDLAEQFFRKAVELRPMRPGPHNGLGMLLMRMGREPEAREVLDKAADADPFNKRVTNSLKVLRHLDKYETVKTEHFELRFDPKTDRALGQFMAEQLEVIYADLAEQFDYRPKGPFLVEVFNSHEMFSGRVVALPDLHTIGACTGRMMAMVSPRGKGIGKPFNWGRVLRHELVHIFNLDQTNFQVPHWLTEGLAVQNEGFDRPQDWNQLLLTRVPAGELMTLDNITLGFVRPRTPDDWHMAYCQSHLYVQYAKEKYGPQVIGLLLQAYRDGLDDAGAVAKACKVDKTRFEAGYKAYLQELVKTLHGKPAEKRMSVADLKEAHENNPNDVEIAARLAEAYARQGRKAEARKLTDAVLAKRKGHPLASAIKASLLHAAGDEAEELKVLEAAVDRQTPEGKVLLPLGKLYFNAMEFKKAEEIYELGRKAEPHDSRWLLELARVHAQTGDKAKLIAVLKALAPTDADDIDVRKRLAKLLLDAGKPADAERFARQALEIDVLDRPAQETLFAALAAQKKNGEADRLKKLFGEQ